MSTFGNYEIESAAEKLILFFQSYGYWTTFTLEELRAFYLRNGWDFNKAFFGLMGGWYDDCGPFSVWLEPAEVFIASDSQGNYLVTNHFIDRCSKAADPTNFLRNVDKVTDIIKGHLDKEVDPETKGKPS